VFFHAGLLCPDKGTPILLEAFSAVAARNPNIRLKLAGELMGGLSEESIEDLVSSLGIRDRVEFCGVLRGEALDRAFAEADVFVFSTVAPFESFGLVLIEAMMWGLPIVASDWRANREVLGFNGKANVVYDVSAGSMVNGLEKALKRAIRSEDRWAEWGRRNRLRFLERFGIERLKRNLDDYFRLPPVGT
jgi:glycosyltransferase involved in cell wall biosynthesis